MVVLPVWAVTSLNLQGDQHWLFPIPYSLFPIPYDVEEIMTLLTGK